jgi:DNA-directed RNA polymerase subunit RPC12/RpoP
MDQSESARKSHCIICGKRLSEKAASGAIHWQPSIVDDKGIRCESCRSPKKVTQKGRKTSRK